MRFKLSLKSKKSKIITIIAASLAVVTLVGVLVPFASLRKEKAELLGSVIVDNGPVFIQPAYGIRNEDYAKLYEQEGLVACYMAYESSSLSFAREEIEGGFRDYYSWRNYVQGGEPGELDNLKVWQVMDGGIGYRIYCDDPVKQYGSCILPEKYMSGEDFEDFEVEVVAKHLGLTDRATGKLAYGTGSDAVFNNVSSFRFGYLHCGSFLTGSSAMTYNRTNRWVLTHGEIYNGAADGIYDRACVNANWDTTTYAVTMNVKLDGNYTEKNDRLELSYLRTGEVIPGFTLQPPTQDFVYWKDYKRDIPYTDSVSRFSLFNYYPGVMYSVRVYDHVLDDETRIRNAFVDLLAFYEISANPFLELEEVERVAKLNECATLADFRNVSMGNTDESVMSANLAKMQDIMNQVFSK